MTSHPDSTSLDQAFKAIPDLLRQHARTQPTKQALVCAGRAWTFGELDAFADRMAAFLQQSGVQPGDAVVVCASTSLEYCGVFLGALRAGAVVAPLPPSATPVQLMAMVRDTGARWVFSDHQHAPLLERAPGTILALLDGDAPDPRAAWREPRPAPAHVAIEPDWAFNIIYSSGTTGTPKGIAQSHARRWQHTLSLAAFGADDHAVALAATPLYSNTTLVLLFPMLALGGTTVLMPKFDAASYLALAQRHGVTHTMLVPVQYQRIMDSPAFDRCDLSSFRMKLCTGAPCSPLLKADIVRRWPGRLVELYGSSEGAGACVLDASQFPHKLHTVGRPATGSEIRIVDEHGHELPAGVPGEIVGRSKSMMAGYHNQPDATAGSEWFDSDRKRFLRTGDVGYFDEDGFLVIVDRKKDMIISGGFNIYPADLEAVLGQHPDVVEAAVVGVPSDRWGETPVAYVVARAGAAPQAEPLREWANARLGRHQRIAQLHLIETLPRNPMGKVLKRVLRERHMAD